MLVPCADEPCADAARLVGLPMMECRLRVLVACCRRELTLRGDAPRCDCRGSRTYGSWLYSNEYTNVVRCVIVCTYRSSCALKVRLLPLTRRGKSDAAVKPYEFFQVRIPPSPLHIPALEARSSVPSQHNTSTSMLNAMHVHLHVRDVQLAHMCSGLRPLLPR